MQTVKETIKAQQPELSNNMAQAFALLAMADLSKKLTVPPKK
jgi:hypothetical protein